VCMSVRPSVVGAAIAKRLVVTKLSWYYYS